MKSACLALLVASASACGGGQFPYGATGACFNCPAGKYAEANSPSCTVCPGGTFAAAGQTACNDDPRSTFDESALGEPHNVNWGVPIDADKQIATAHADLEHQETPDHMTTGAYDTHHVHTANKNVDHSGLVANAAGSDGSNIGTMDDYTTPAPNTRTPTLSPTKAPTAAPTTGCADGTQHRPDGWSGPGDGENYCNHGECVDGAMIWNRGQGMRQCAAVSADDKPAEDICTHVWCEYKADPADISQDRRVFIYHTNAVDQTPTNKDWHGATAHACGYNKATDICQCFCGN